MKTQKHKTIDEYINSFPENIKKILQQIRLTVRKAAPEATETIKYDMPTFVLNGNLVYFGAFKKHIGFYPVSKEMESFPGELTPYINDKGTAKFMLDNPMPSELITRIVKYRVKENSISKKKY
jgi:uncharacterized protein YdhG (YjbR/CyaY superfamily)